MRTLRIVSQAKQRSCVLTVCRREDLQPVLLFTYCAVNRITSEISLWAAALHPSFTFFFISARKKKKTLNHLQKQAVFSSLHFEVYHTAVSYTNSFRFRPVNSTEKHLFCAAIYVYIKKSRLVQRKSEIQTLKSHQLTTDIITHSNRPIL